MNSQKKYERYQRQILLKGFGIEAQQKLLQSKVLVIGAGGLCCPALQYLVGAGVGKIGIVDNDIVSITNLHRQVLYGVDDIGFSKAEVAAKRLRTLNDEIAISFFNERMTNENALSIIKSYDIVIDGTDNFSTRYLINDACVLLRKPLVYGAISQYEGQVAVFNLNDNKRSANYRDLFPEPPKDDEVLNCAEAGVLGVLPGIIGSMMVNETIKLITGIGKPLINSLLTYNALDNSSYEFNLFLNKDAQMQIPKDEDAFLKMDYDWLCASKVDDELEIDCQQFDLMIDGENTLIIDVREKDEQPFVNEFKHVNISLSDLIDVKNELKNDTVVVFCQSGKRSLLAAKMLNDIYSDKSVYSLKGGIVEWKRKHALQVDENKIRSLLSDQQ